MGRGEATRVHPGAAVHRHSLDRLNAIDYLKNKNKKLLKNPTDVNQFSWHRMRASMGALCGKLDLGGETCLGAFCFGGPLLFILFWGGECSLDL